MLFYCECLKINVKYLGCGNYLRERSNASLSCFRYASVHRDGFLVYNV